MPSRLAHCLCTSLMVTCWLVCGTLSGAEPIANIPQAWASPELKYNDTDSLAACRLQSGKTIVLATSKGGHWIHLFDAETGKPASTMHQEWRYGSQGKSIGQFARPNGICVVHFIVGGERSVSSNLPPVPVVLVVERDNARVQAFWPDGPRPAGMFGQGKLHRPYGCAVGRCSGVGYGGGGYSRYGSSAKELWAPSKSNWLLYVTETDVPPEHTVKVFELERRPCETCGQDIIDGKLVKSFGATSGKGRIHEAESIAIDHKHKHVLLCDEAAKPKNVKVYTTDGAFTGMTFADGMIEGDPEGIAVYYGSMRRGVQEDPGFVILTDQQDAISVWHVFERKTYKHLGAFTGEPTVANTDGIALLQGRIGKYRRGMFFAVDDDADVRGYDLGKIIDLVRRWRKGG